MFRIGNPTVQHELEAMLAAISKSQAVIEFELDGTIIDANENFQQALGYKLEEIKGKHHRMFVMSAERDSDTYRNFWRALSAGEFRSGEFKRIAKDGREVWIQASYNPIFGRDGKPFKVVKFASDITAEKLRSAEVESQLAAIGKSQAVIEFTLEGNIIDANDNFLSAMGYTLDEIKGQHHRMFVEEAERESDAYRAFWKALAAGEFRSGEFKRVGKGGKEVWIQASYNPVLDASGRPFKVVKFASDITAEKLRTAEVESRLAAIGKSQAVIEFTLDGNIIDANENFLSAMGYTLEEIKGKHHGMFVEAGERDSQAYRDFWQALGSGRFQQGEFKRVGKGGKEVWIQASYNPILDASGRPFKVVKFASDVTQQVIARKRSEHVRQMMESVASGAEELKASVNEIAESMARSKDKSDEAYDLTAQADGTTERLAEATDSMGSIIDAIDAITRKINLLALNATIESARAGEAGKGFAVVATEVKNLANQAKVATEQIAQEIEGMRGVSSEVVTNLRSVRDSIAQVREFVTSTAAAVDEQNTVTSEMSASMQRASAEANQIGQ